MKNHLKASAILLGVIFMSNTSCEKERFEGIKTYRFNTPIELMVNEKAILTKSTKEVLLTLTNLSDSRCAENVQCVWAGNAVVEIQLAAPDGSKTGLSLCLGQCNNVVQTTDSASVSLNSTNYTVILKEVKNEGFNKAVLLVKKS